VFVLQVTGRKQWRVHEPVLAAPMPDEPWDTVAADVAARAQERAVIEEVLEPGDCLYLPRGFLHSAAALGETSIHLTFGVHAVVERDLVQAVLTAVQKSGWRSSMPVGWDPMAASGRAEIEGVLSALVQALDDVDPAAVGAALHDERSARQRPAPVLPLAQAEAAATLTATQNVRLRQHLGARIERDPATGVDELVLGGRRRLPVKPGEREAVKTLLSGRSVEVASLPVSGDATAVELAQRLLRMGVLVVHDAVGTSTPPSPR
jgi:bifunctional lysine-specific demethylase and histidyl-hydroxylase NO66